nr:TPA_asm: M97 iORF [Murid betaherpesvirus 1]DBA07861.1 TPA_asm: M97 iORF [Murid betaherpesvirus 1]
MTRETRRSSGRGLSDRCGDSPTRRRP